MRNRGGEEEVVGASETVVFSGKVFEGLKLRDKHVRREVELNIPYEQIVCFLSFLSLQLRFSSLTVRIVNTRN